ncbi:MAG: hypothetical protein E7052_04560 [Lentisphaerae bacterium]|nr:hypothetical protein [Lentisphaerota bacterium]
MRVVLTFFLLGMFSMLSGGVFSIRQDGNEFAVLYRNNVLVSTVSSSNLGSDAAGVRSSVQTMPDGTRVWNIWRQDKACRIRQEIALKADGSQVEISMKGEAAPYSENPARLLQLALPMDLLDGKKYTGLTVNTRVWKPGSGVLSRQKTPPGALDNVRWRYFNLSNGKDFNVVFDLNPIGAGDYTAMYSAGVIKGVWDIIKGKNNLILRGGSHLSGIGGMTGAKVVIREGVMEKDYFRNHALKSYKERGPLAANYVLSFGSLKHGKEFVTADDKVITPDTPYGWKNAVKLQRNIDSPEGVYYSSMSGQNAVFRFSKLIPGVHIFTVAAGNYAGHKNKFSITVNGRSMVRDLAVGKKQLAVASLPVWVDDSGVADIEFSGDFLVSSIAVQCLIAAAEDFSFNRGYWVTDGYEPAVLFRNQDYRPAAELNPALELICMPTPGQEAVGPGKLPDTPVELPPDDAPGGQWRWTANCHHLGSNSATLDECRDPADMKKVFDKLQQDGASVVMVNGMMSRHTYPAHLDRGVEMIRKIVAEAHKRNIKIIDHQDVTLLWNTDSGFRVMAQRLPETVRNLITMVPNGQFCIMNPVTNRMYTNYAMRTVKAGIDGLQADEAAFMHTVCGCSHCRNTFYKDTNWQLPLNELDKRLFDRQDPLWKQFLEWRKIKLGNWWVDFRREAKKYNPDLVLCMYSTHWGFMSQASSLRMGGDLTQQARAINYLGTEVMTRNCLLSARALAANRKMVNLLNVAFNAPIWAWIYAGLDGEDMYEAFYAGWAICNMNNQSAMTRWAAPPQRETTFKSFEASPDNMRRDIARTVCKAALLFSASSRDWNRGGAMYPQALGLAQTLEELHVPYEFIGAMSLKKEVLKKYNFLSVNFNGCLSDQEVSVIKEFARNGGTVHLIGGAGMFDAMGNDRPVWAFADVMQYDLKRPARKNVIQKVGFHRDPAKADTLKNPTRHYVPSVMPKRSSLYGFNAKNRPVPVFVNQRYGKGRFIHEIVPLAGLLYFEEGRVNEVWRNELDEKLAEKYRQCVSRMTAKSAWWSVEAPSTVYSTIYKQNKDYAVHFFNAQTPWPAKGELLPMKIPADPFPALARDITFTLPGKNVREVFAVSPDFAGRKQLAFRQADKSVTVTLNKELLKAYTIVWVKF